MSSDQPVPAAPPTLPTPKEDRPLPSPAVPLPDTEQAPGARDERDLQRDIERVRDRRNNILTTILAGLLGGVLGAVFSLIGVQRQIDSQASQAQHEFLQDQRQSAYARFAVDEQELRRNQNELMNALNPKLGMPPGSTYQSLRDPINDAYNKVLQDVGTIDLVGSDEAAEIADMILDIHIERHEWVITGSRYAQGGTIGLDERRIAQGIGRFDDHLTTLERKFVNTGRSDLGTSD